MIVAIVIMGLLAFSFSSYVSYDTYRALEIMNVWSDNTHAEKKDIAILIAAPLLTGILFVLALVK